MSTRFRTTVELNGKTASGLEVPSEIVERLGAGRRPPVRVTVNEHTYRSTIASMGGRYMVPLSAENRARAKVQAGDAVRVAIEVDTAPREVSLPADFARALARNSKARAFYEGLSNSNKKWHVLSIEGAKAADTRARRIEKSVAMLAEGRAR